MSNECPKCNMLDRLEAERVDQSWRLAYKKPVSVSKEHPAYGEPKSDPKPVKKPREPKPFKQDDRDKMMFNAGRYSAGDRDEIAATAWLKLQKTFED